MSRIRSVTDGIRDIVKGKLIVNGINTIGGNNTGVANGYLQVKDGTNTLAFDPNEISCTTNLVISTAGATSLTGDFTASGNITAFSDIKFKKNIEVIPNALDKIATLNGYTFDRSNMDVPRQTGVIAQEVQAVLPEAVTEHAEGLSVAYGNMVGLLIEGIKEQQEMIDALYTEIDKLKGA